FAPFRESVLTRLAELGYEADWRLIYSSKFGVPQLRPRFILVAMRQGVWENFSWPEPAGLAPTVGEVLVDLMAANGWGGANAWAARANSVAPTIVGGSKKHGGADLGPTRARAAWLKLGVDGRGIADASPGRES